LGYRRNGLLPHPLQVAVGRGVRYRIIRALVHATDVVFSHFHGDHVPLLNANPYQLAIGDLPAGFGKLRCWTKGDDGLSPDMARRFADLANLLGDNLQVAQGRSEGPLSFSQPVPHGLPDSPMGTVMMTRVQVQGRVFVHASDIQLLDRSAVEQVIDWQPDIVLAAGPPLYLGRLSPAERELAWFDALQLAQNVPVVILDHHLLRSVEGAVWLDALSAAAGRRVYCAADFMGRPRQLLEANRQALYERMPVADTWHADYANNRSGLDGFGEALGYTSDDRYDDNGGKGQ
jgi:predicted metallo-beta-lactamase superfamily hydrolase